MAIRTFLALDLDDAVRREIVSAAESLPVGASKVRWVEPENLHVTLKFLGDVPDDGVMDVCRTVQDVAAGLEPGHLRRGRAHRRPAARAASR